MEMNIARSAKISFSFMTRKVWRPKTINQAIEQTKTAGQSYRKGYEKKSESTKEAERHAWATENKIAVGGKKSCSSRAG